MHDLQTAREILDQKVKREGRQYFEYVKHRLQDAVSRVDQAQDKFEANQDYHSIKELVHELQHLDLGFERAILLTNRVSSLNEEIHILEDLETKEHI